MCGIGVLISVNLVQLIVNVRGRIDGLVRKILLIVKSPRRNRQVGQAAAVLGQCTEMELSPGMPGQFVQNFCV